MNDNFTAETVSNRKSLADLNTEVEDIYLAIKQRINECESLNQSELLYELPTNFTMANMELVDLQLIIYARVIELLKKKGFEVYFVKTKGFSLLVKWTSALSHEEKEKMRNIILSTMPQEEDIKRSSILSNIYKKEPLDHSFPLQGRNEPKKLPEIIPVMRQAAVNKPSPLSNIAPNWAYSGYVPVTRPNQ